MTRARGPQDGALAERFDAVEQATRAHARACRAFEDASAAFDAAVAERNRTREVLVAAVRSLDGTCDDVDAG